MWGKRVGFWEASTMPRLWGGSQMPLPLSINVVPVVVGEGKLTILAKAGSNSPVMARRIVVLPEPDGPKRIVHD